MAIRSIARSGVAGQKYINFLAGNDAFDPGSYELIGTAFGTGSSATITFSSIPQNYKDLQIRGVSKVINANIFLSLRFLLNGATSGQNDHSLWGDGSSVASSSNQANTHIQAYGSTQGTGITESFGTIILDLLDYASTAKNKTTRSWQGFVDQAGATQNVALGSGLLQSTSAITSITINNQVSASFNSGSRFSLYGIKG
jgi:hypothetical protein